MTEKFERELRYVVFKLSDLQHALSEADKEMFVKFAERVDEYREEQGKPQMECVVVESDWPEYEHVWKMIEERVLKELEEKKAAGEEQQ